MESNSSYLTLLAPPVFSARKPYRALPIEELFLADRLDVKHMSKKETIVWKGDLADGCTAVCAFVVLSYQCI